MALGDTIVKDGLLLYYNGKENDQPPSMIQDLSGNSLHGDIHGTTLQPDGTFYMDGVDDYFHLPIFEGLMSYTIEFWLNVSGDAINTTHNFLCFGGTENSVRVDKEAGDLANIRTAHAGQSRSGSNSNLTASDIMTHFTVSYDADTKTVSRSIRGKKLSDLTYLADMNFSVAGTLGRANPSSSSNMFKGYFGLLRIYNRNLSYDELMHNMNVGLEVGLEEYASPLKYFEDGLWRTIQTRKYIDGEWKLIPASIHNEEWK